MSVVKQASRRGQPPALSPGPELADQGAFPDLTDPQVLASWPTTPSRPRTKWLKLFMQYRPNQDEVPAHVVWFWRYSERIDRDPAWAAWWNAGSGARLVVSQMVPAPFQRQELHPDDDTVHIAAGSPEIFARLIALETPDFNDKDPAMVDQVVELLIPVLADAFARVGRELGLGAPPPLPPRRPTS